MNNHLVFALRERADEIRSKPPTATTFVITEFEGDSLLPESQLQRLRHKLLAASYKFHGSNMAALFHQIDRNKTGAIDTIALSSMVKRLVPDITGAQLDSLMKLADKNRRGVLNKEEFLTFFGSQRQGYPPEESIGADGRRASQALNKSFPGSVVLSKPARKGGFNRNYESPYILEAQRQAELRAKKALLKIPRYEKKPTQSDWVSDTKVGGLFDPTVRKPGRVFLGKKSPVRKSRLDEGDMSPGSVSASENLLEMEMPKKIRGVRAVAGDAMVRRVQNNESLPTRRPAWGLDLNISSNNGPESRNKQGTAQSSIPSPFGLSVEQTETERSSFPSSSSIIAESILPAFRKTENCDRQHVTSGAMPKSNTILLSNRSTSPFNSSELRTILGDEYVSDGESEVTVSDIDEFHHDNTGKAQLQPELGNNSSRMEEAQIEFLASISKAMDAISQTGANTRRSQPSGLQSPRFNSIPVRTPMKVLGADESRQMFISTPARPEQLKALPKEQILGMLEDKLREMKVIENNVQGLIAQRKEVENAPLLFQRNTAMHIPTSSSGAAPDADRDSLRAVHALSAAATDAMSAPSLLETFEVDQALQSVFGISDSRRQDIPIPEQIRLRRVFEKAGAHGDADEDHLLEQRATSDPSRLTIVRPSGDLEDRVYQYRIEAMKAQKLRSVPFRPMGASMTVLADKLANAVVDDLLWDLSSELDSIFSDYAEKFIREV